MYHIGTLQQIFVYRKRDILRNELLNMQSTDDDYSFAFCTINGPASFRSSIILTQDGSFV